jgi:hypothetical protein
MPTNNLRSVMIEERKIVGKNDFYDEKFSFAIWRKIAAIIASEMRKKIIESIS